MHTPTLPPALADLPADWLPSFDLTDEEVRALRDCAKVTPFGGGPSYTVGGPHAVERYLRLRQTRRGAGPLGLNCDDTAVADADNARARRPRKGARS